MTDHVVIPSQGVPATRTIGRPFALALSREPVFECHHHSLSKGVTPVTFVTFRNIVTRCYVARSRNVT